jgi:serine dehydrogenase proteinase
LTQSAPLAGFQLRLPHAANTIDSMAKRSTAKRRGPPAGKTIHYFANIFPKDRPLTQDFAKEIAEPERLIRRPVWLFVQDGKSDFDTVDYPATRGFFGQRGRGLRRGEPIALLIDSYGGNADPAFEFATLLQKYCGGFIAIVPRHAKSAATLLAMGAEAIIFSDFGELGPLDMQILDPEREDRQSVLDDVQALERLNAFVLSAIDETMFLLKQRSRMKIATLMPHVREIVTGMTRPLFEKIDVVKYTRMSRLLKVAEEYAIRLLAPKAGLEQATAIASHMAEKYPVHEFIIYPDEAKAIGLNVVDPTTEQAAVLERLIPHLDGLTAIGRIQEVVK